MKNKQYKAIGNWSSMSIGYINLHADPATRIVTGFDAHPELVDQLLRDNVIEVYIEPKPVSLKPVLDQELEESKTGVK